MISSVANPTSLIFTCYNQQDYFYQSIKLLEKYIDLDKSFEVILIDSSADSFQAPSFVKYFQIPNCGPSNARNFGVSKATGKWIIFCDADDFVNPFAIKQISKFTEIQTEADAVFFDFKLEEDSRIIAATEKNFNAFQQPAKLQLQSITDPVFFLQKFFPVHAVILRRSVFEKIKFHEPQWFIEDVRFYLELAMIPDVQMRYCSDEAFHSFHRYFKEKKSLSTSNEQLFWEAVSSNFQYLSEHARLGYKQKLKLVKLLLLNYQSVSSDLQKHMLLKNKMIWNYFFGLPRLLRNKVLFRVVVSVTRLGR